MKRREAGSGSAAVSPKMGILEWFRPGEYEQVEAVLRDLKQLEVKELRTGFSWADWHTEQGRQWYDWLLPRLAQEVNLLPCFSYTPPSLGVTPKTSSPPRRPRDFADFLDVAITIYGKYFEYVELWNEPNNMSEWDCLLDSGWNIFCEMIEAAAYWAKQRGKKTVLGGISPPDPNWLELIARAGVLKHVDVVGIHGFPGTWDLGWPGWNQAIERAQKALERHGLECEIWITEAGYSTWRFDGYEQLKEFVTLLEAPVPRVYWYGARDLHPDLPHNGDFHKDERHYHFGLKRWDGSPKLLFRVWAAEGLEGVKRFDSFNNSHSYQKVGMFGETKKSSTGTWRPGNNEKRTTFLLTGGAGFIGTNLANRLLSNGGSVIILDNLSRPGVEKNVRWLRETHGDLLHVQVADIRNPFVVKEAVRGVDGVYHFAAQVAVTSALVDPATDFEVNARGTLNLLEALRSLKNPPPLLFTSTNKVYGEMKDIKLSEKPTRYEPQEAAYHLYGFNETRPLDFYSPYGCSKGTADQYVIDYARIYNLPAVVFRMSCIYGAHQFGTEDQGWVAHFLIRSLQGEPITLYGNGKQVRDVLFVEDLVDALLLAHKHIDRIRGHAFNIGGGAENTTSLIEILGLISELQGMRPEIEFGPWRKGDQRYYVSDTRSFTAATGWAPRTPVKEGVVFLHKWLLENASLFDAEARTREMAR